MGKESFYTIRRLDNRKKEKRSEELVERYSDHSLFLKNSQLACTRI